MCHQEVDQTLVHMFTHFPSHESPNAIGALGFHRKQ